MAFDLDKLKTRYTELSTKMKAEIGSANAIEEKYPDGGITQEDSEKAQGHIAKFDEMRVEQERLKALVEANGEAEKAQASAGQAMWRKSIDGEGDADVDVKSYREFEVKDFIFHPLMGLTQATKTVRYNVPIAVEGKDYPNAFESYVKNGSTFMGAKDKKTLSLGLDPAGGYLAPPDYQLELLKKIATLATVRGSARVVQTSRDLAQWPKINYTSDDKYTSGVRLTWTGEQPASSTTHRVTDPVFGIVNIPIHTGMASLPLTNNLLEDSAFDVQGISTDLFAEAFSLGENDAFWNGNGVSRPMGILTQVDGDGPASVNSGTAATYTADGILNLWGALPSQYEAMARWYMRKASELVIRKLKDSNNNYIWPVWPQMGGFGAHPRELVGFPTVRDEFVPAVAAGAYPLVFGDLRGYIIVDRVGLTIQRLDEIYAETNITVLLAKKRVGGYLAEPWRVKVQKISA